MITLLKGDCLQVMKDISSNSIDLILCDLPYGCLTSPKGNPAHQRAADNGGQQNGCAWDIPLDLNAFWKEVRRIRRNDHTPTIHFCTTKFGFDLYASNPKEFRYDIVWDKQRGVSFLSANKMPMRSHEMIYVFSKAGAYYNRVDISGNFQSWVRKRSDDTSRQSTQYGGATRNDTEGGDGKRCALSVVQNPTSAKKGGHPTEKPMALYEWLIARYCPPNGTLLDPTGGSCNSVFQAHAMGHNGIAIEMNSAFYDKAVARKLKIEPV